jgi:hypothetical protein
MATLRKKSLKSLEDRLKDYGRREEELEQEFKRLKEEWESRKRPDDSTLTPSQDLVDLGEVPSCGVHKTDDQAIGTGAWTNITFGTTTWDTGQMADLANNGITIKRAGIYLVTCTVMWEAEGTGLRGLLVYVTGGIVFTGQSNPAHATVNQRQSCSTPRYFELGDLIKAQVYHNRGVNTTLMGSTATGHGPQLTATLLSDSGDVRTEMA